ncbi:uncharacterized protein AMSG_06417 [Thecamonas trahens ATCC 50062]|uniref:Uncharacterized protein n=1 Tax=Thecamonas trahens ATCC 50062 TaxID=461836 RepID=A0A0L0DDG3_THETB|nr:hypothetical protein AMSG_06417 [Thecamonas trahens ATCC 50062]KNC50260.1 hypothetical protein AMSG_06417 [Thecamonas trahens ATCC 50062]|eukprot:XP_013757089.1 hypothetical protein AMSG_06417 [Thecamonas trahens ATCC 50062]
MAAYWAGAGDDEAASYSSEDRHDYSVLLESGSDDEAGASGGAPGDAGRIPFRPSPGHSIDDALRALEDAGLVYQPEPNAKPPGPWAEINPPEPPPKPRYVSTYTVEGGWETRLLPESEWIPADPRKSKITAKPPPYGRHAQCVRDFLASADLPGDEPAVVMRPCPWPRPAGACCR